MIKALSPFLQVYSLKEAESFYIKLGFKVAWRYPEDSPTHMSMNVGHTEISFVLKESTHEIDKGDLYITVDHVDQYHQQLNERDISTGPIINSAYGMRDFSVNDPWGHHLVFGQFIPVEECKNSLNPFCNEGAFVFVSNYNDRLEIAPLMVFQEQEGTTAIMRKADALAHHLDIPDTWAFITIGYNSELSMVGLTAKMSTALADQQIPCNVVAAFHHDHIFVPYAMKDEAMDILSSLEI